MTMLRIVAFAVALAAAFDAFAYARPETLAAQAGFTQRMGNVLPGALAFRDESGRAVRIADYYGDAPIVLVFAWFGCRTLCPTVIGNLAQSVAKAGIAPGRYGVIVASIDPRDAPADAARMKRNPVVRDARAWHFLTGREDAIDALANAAGFRYAYDADTHQYAHPAGFVILTPDGRVSRYFFGFDFAPSELRDALRDAGNDAIASPVDRLLLLCFHFAPTGRYSADVLQALRIASVLLVGCALAFVVVKRRTASAR
ncbi:MAG TPA: SCO family protein [Casimicrobiaceae bacterium]|nr:SCO family protein [Casimicrobiaceae bacterium]